MQHLFFIITVCQRWHCVQVQAAAQVGDLVPGHQAEQPVKAIVDVYKRQPMFYAGLVMVANDLNTWENEGKFDEKARTDRR